MSVKLEITVADIALTLSAGYDSIKVYRSPTETSNYFEITTPTARIPLQTGVSNYEYTDYNGTTEHWYKVTFYDSSIPQESTYSDAFQGEYIDTAYSTASYPEEGVYTNLDRLILDKVRGYIGDKKELTRDYVSALGGFSSISADGFTHTLSNPRGWPVSVSLDNTLYTSTANPRVNDYQFVTFSGVQINTISGTLDIWYYHFRYSDSEILRVYNGLTPPYPLEAEDVTFELAVLSTAIEILISELFGSSASSGAEVDIFEEIRINPKVGLDSKYGNLKTLLALRQSMIDDIVGDDSDIFGVLID